jgi:2-C-methyl-D-erythritol 2,4-cyclodiphosphate synthase
MEQIRVGFGFDVHPFEKESKDREAGEAQSSVVRDETTQNITDDRCLVLGGVKFDGMPPLLGHSDADALAHAVSDAMLGAAGMGDIGMMFPDDNESYKNADSLWMLSVIAERLSQDGWHLLNADCTVVTEKPKLAPVIKEIMGKLSEAAKGQVHVKATRPEQLGALGRNEGLACFAVALIGRS